MCTNMVIGDQVEFTDATAHDLCPQFFPPAGTLGTVTEISGTEPEIRVQWQDGSTAGNGNWYVSLSRVRESAAVRIRKIFRNQIEDEQRNGTALVFHGLSFHA